MRKSTGHLVAAIGVASLAGGIVALSGTGGGDTAWLRVLLYLTGGLLGIWTVLTLYRGWVPTASISPPAVEEATEYPAPGDEFDTTLSQFDGRGQGFLPDRSAIHRRLQDLAVSLLVRRGYTHEAATTAVEEGEWPDDPVVATFLQNPDAKLARSRWERIRELTGRGRGPSDFQRLVKRTVDSFATSSQAVSIDDDTESVIVREPGDQSSRGQTERGSPSATAATDGAGPDDDVTTGRWRTTVLVAFAFVGFGLVLREPVVVLAGAVPLGFTAYAKASTPPACSLVVERAISANQASPGDVVEVTTTVRNEGDHPVPDLRVVDGVPDRLSVTDGSPRRGTTLRPGESTTITYSVTARRGVHEFSPPYAVVRGYAGTTGRVCRLPAADGTDRSVTCVPSLEALPLPVPLQEQSGEYLGRLPAGGGDGVAFHSTREYRPGDPSTRIDWKHLARSPADELTTVRFREERAATVVLAVVADATAYVSAGPDSPVAFEQSIEAAGRLFGSLLAAGDRVGITSIGSTQVWVEPDTGADHRRRVEEILATDPAFPPTAPDTDVSDPQWVRKFHRRFPAESQVVLLSPLCDTRYQHVIRRLLGYGHPVTVVSPDPTVDGTVGRRLVRLERQLRIESLRESGVRVVDWDPTDDLAIALGRAATRWST